MLSTGVSCWLQWRIDMTKMQIGNDLSKPVASVSLNIAHLLRLVSMIVVRRHSHQLHGIGFLIHAT